MKRLRLPMLILLACAAAVASSCAHTRRLSGYVLKKNSIEVTNSRSYPKSELSAYIKQSESGNKFNGIKGLFSSPVMLDESLIEPSLEGMLRHLEYEGYYNSSIDTVITRKRRTAKVTYKVTLGKQYPISEIEYAIADPAIDSIYRADSANHTVKRGTILSESALEGEAERLAAMLRDKGYYGYTKNYMFNFADTTAVADSALLRIELRNYTRNELPSAARQLTPYTIRHVSYQMPQGLNVTPRFLGEINLLSSGMPYSETLISNTYQRFAANHIFNTVNISLTPVDSTGEVDCLIALTPSDLQNFEVNMEASTNSTGLIGITPSLTYNHYNLFGGGEVFTLGFRGNFQFKINESARSNEFAITTGLTFPKLLLLPFIESRTQTLPSTKVSLAYNYQNRPEYTRNILSATYGYSWAASRNLRYSVTLPGLSVIKIFNIDEDFYKNLNSSYLQYQYQDHFDLGAAASIYYTTDPAVNPTGSYFYLRTDLASSGLLLNSGKNLWQENQRGERLIWGIPYAQYLRAQVSAVETLRFGSDNNFALAARLLAGVGYAYGNSSFLPLEQMFYAGGANSMRGWQSRTLGPGRSPLDDQFSIYNQVGDMRLEANLELRFPLFWKLSGALFTDWGNIWNLPKSSSLTQEDEDYALSVFSFKDMMRSGAMSWGLGARLDFGLLLVRVDVGFKGYDPESQHWLAPREWVSRDGYAVHLGIGYPF